jgi:hypothetical protein
MVGTVVILDPLLRPRNSRYLGFPSWSTMFLNESTSNAFVVLHPLNSHVGGRPEQLQYAAVAASYLAMNTLANPDVNWYCMTLLSLPRTNITAKIYGSLSTIVSSYAGTATTRSCLISTTTSF